MAWIFCYTSLTEYLINVNFREKTFKWILKEQEVLMYNADNDDGDDAVTTPNKDLCTVEVKRKIQSNNTLLQI